MRALACIDTSTPSALLVTTRIQRLLPSSTAASPIGVLAPETAVALLLEVSNTGDRLGPPPTPQSSPLLFQAVEACGRLPLAVAVASADGIASRRTERTRPCAIGLK